MASSSSRHQQGPDRRQLRALVQSFGLPCGPLVVLPPNSKRVVISDQEHVVIRAQRADDPALRDPEQEIAWAMRFNAVTYAQVPFWFKPVATRDGWLLTLWQYLPGDSVSAAEDAAAHGRAVRLLHDRIPLSQIDQRSADPGEQLRVARHRAVQLVNAGHPQAAALSAHVERAGLYLGEQYPAGSLVASHGDVNPNTALAMTGGGIALMDFDSACVAPRILDLASGVYTYHRYFNASMATAFLDGYGQDGHIREDELAAHMWIRHLRITIARAESGKDIRDDLDWLAAAAGSLE